MLDRVSPLFPSCMVNPDIETTFSRLAEEAYFERNKNRLGLDAADYARLKQGRYNDVLPERVTLHGQPFDATSAYWLLHSLDEIFVREVYRFTPATDTPLIIDCGASWGVSLRYFTMRHPGATIIAFEPDAKVFELLRGNVARFAPDTMQLVNQAVWTSNEILSFASDGTLGGALIDTDSTERLADGAVPSAQPPRSAVTDEVVARVRASPRDAKRIIDEAVLQHPAAWEEISEAGLAAAKDSWDGAVNVYYGTYRTETVDVQAVRLRDVLARQGTVELLKIDIEGAESAVIEDCLGVLDRVERLFVEYHSEPSRPQQLDSMLRGLREAGFRYHCTEATKTYEHPFERIKDVRFDQQLNIYCYRPDARR